MAVVTITLTDKDGEVRAGVVSHPPLTHPDEGSTLTNAQMTAVRFMEWLKKQDHLSGNGRGIV